MKSVVRGPFQLERSDGPVPDQAVGMLFPQRRQLPLEIRFLDFKGGDEMDVIGGYAVLHSLS